MLTHAQAEQSIRDAGMRITLQRRAVIDALVDNRTHPSAEDVTERVQDTFPSVSRSTVYATLHELVELGLILQLEAPQEKHFDPEVTPHYHLYCTKCRGVVDLELSDTLQTSLTEEVVLKGCDLDASSVSMTGLCPGCRSS